MRLAANLQRLWRCQRGVAAMEYAFILPMFVMLVMGVISTAQLASAVNGLHYSVQEAARCWAVNTTACPTTSATVAFAQSKYAGPDVGPTYSAGSAACGRTVSVTGSYKLELAVSEISVPLTATACFPPANLP